MQAKLSLVKKLLWFVGLWCAGFMGLTLVSYLIRLLMYSAGLKS